MTNNNSSVLCQRNVRGISLRMEGVTLLMTCAHCQQFFDSQQDTMGGVPLGDHQCPACGHKHTSDPASYNPIMTSYFVDSDFSRAASKNVEVMRVATSWHQQEPWQTALRYKGIDLGPPTEREISSHFNCAYVVEQPEPTSK